MSRQIRVLRQALRDIEDVLSYTLANFGEAKYRQYQSLIQQAIDDIASDPDAPPARHRPELHPDARTFHIARRGKHARHFLLYRVKEGHIEIARFLYDGMDLPRHLPTDYQR